MFLCICFAFAHKSEPPGTLAANKLIIDSARRQIVYRRENNWTRFHGFIHAHISQFLDVKICPCQWMHGFMWLNFVTENYQQKLNNTKKTNFAISHFNVYFSLSERSPFEGSCCGGYAGGDDSKSCSSDSEPTPPTRYRVVLLGESGTGKTGKLNVFTPLSFCYRFQSWLDLHNINSRICSALVNQFMTSEYMHTYDASLDDEFGEKTVSILLDGEESEMVIWTSSSIFQFYLFTSIFQFHFRYLSIILPVRWA